MNHPHLTQPSMIAVSHCPLATVRIVADGNCFFRSVSLAVTRSQEFHEELRLLITMYMIHKSTDPMLSSLGSPDGSMESYNVYEAIKDADSGHLGYRIGGDFSSIIA